MICPHCGYDMGKKNKCLRCGYEANELAVVDDDKRDESVKEERSETKVIDPCNVFLTHPYGYDEYEDDIESSGDPFGDLFNDLFGDPISDLLGGLFGFNVGGRPRRDERSQPKKGKKQGPVVEVDDVELVDSADDEPEIIYKDIDDGAEPVDKKTSQTEDNGDKKHFGIKHPFKRRKK